MNARPLQLLYIGTVLVLILLIAVVVSRRGRTHATSPVWILEVELRSAPGTFAQLFWTVDGNFAEEQSARRGIMAGAQGQTLRFLIPARVRWLRFDPADAPGDVVIGRMVLRDAADHVLTTFAADDLAPGRDVASITRQGSEMLVVASGSDPSVILPVGCLSSPVDSERKWPFTATSLILANLAAVGLLAACFWAIGLDLFRALTEGMLQSSVRWGWVWLPVVFLLVFAAKLLVLREFPVTAPSWDQWDAEARGLYVPYYNCELSWSQMFGLHNEHRIFFSRLLALDLVRLNGQWDPRLQQVVNAGMHSLIAVLLVSILWRGLECRRLDLLALIVVPVFALPHAWENTLMGFQSAFYLLVLFSLLALWLTTAFAAGSCAWWLGWLCALCSLFSVAGGVVLPAIIVGIALLRILNPSRRWRAFGLTLLAAVPLLIIGVLAASPPLPGHEPLKARTLESFVSALLRNLAWPWIDEPLAGVLMWLPIAAFVLVVVLRRRSPSTFELFVIGLGSWVFVQAAVIAYGRGGGAAVPVPRYQDVLSLGFVANTLILLAAARQLSTGLGKGLATITLSAWGLAALAGLDTLTISSIATLESWRPHWQAQALNVRRFVLNGDAQELKSKPPLDVPYPIADRLVETLQQPIVRRLLPPAVRQPIRVEPRIVTDEAFVPHGVRPITLNDPMSPGWGSYAARGNLSSGNFESHIGKCDRGGYLKVPVAGYLGLSGLSLAVRAVSTGEQHEIKPDRLAREDWVNVTVPCPEGSFVVVADDRRSDYWFAFREPVEVGWASISAETLIEHSFRLMLAAFAMMVAALKIT